jgi:hypothetical protein
VPVTFPSRIGQQKADLPGHFLGHLLAEAKRPSVGFYWPPIIFSVSK